MRAAGRVADFQNILKAIGAGLTRDERRRQRKKIRRLHQSFDVLLLLMR